MIVKIQLLRDDGTVLTQCVMNAFNLGGWEAPLGCPLIEGTQKLDGFTYLPSVNSTRITSDNKEQP